MAPTKCRLSRYFCAVARRPDGCKRMRETVIYFTDRRRGTLHSGDNHTPADTSRKFQRLVETAAATSIVEIDTTLRRH